MSASAGPWTLPSGQRLYAMTGLDALSLAAIPSAALKPVHFAASPDDVPGWAAMTKSRAATVC